jgi:Zn-dependent protease with chaperone function
MVLIIFSSIIYFVVCNWIQLYYLLGNLIKPKHKLITVNGKGLLSKLKKKTGIDLVIKTMSERNKAIGFMVSMPPFKPMMIFSERLYQLLNKDEFEWVALHESAHYLKWHNLRFALVQIIVLMIGIDSLQIFSMLTRFITPYFILLSIVYIQLVKHFEYQADLYAIKKMDNPKGLITAMTKMRKINKFLNYNGFLYRLLVIQVPYDERIKMAKNELKLRNKK